MRNILRSNLREIKKYYLKRSSILPNKLSKSLDDEMKEWIKDSFEGSDNVWTLPDLTQKERLNNFCRAIQKKIK